MYNSTSAPCLLKIMPMSLVLEAILPAIIYSGVLHTDSLNVTLKSQVMLINHLCPHARSAFSYLLPHHCPPARLRGRLNEQKILQVCAQVHIWARRLRAEGVLWIGSALTMTQPSISASCGEAKHLLIHILTRGA